MPSIVLCAKLLNLLCNELMGCCSFLRRAGVRLGGLLAAAMSCDAARRCSSGAASAVLCTASISITFFNELCSSFCEGGVLIVGVTSLVNCELFEAISTSTTTAIATATATAATAAAIAASTPRVVAIRLFTVRSAALHSQSASLHPANQPAAR